jgi:enoyl-CoA hydratase
MNHFPASVELSIDGAVATITLNIPERHNSLAGEDIDLFRQHLTAVEGNSDLRVLIVTGAGEKTFCAGAALNQLGSGSISGEIFADMTDQLAAISIPTICSFNGSAYGGGSEIGLACDFRIGVEGMRLFVPPARIGLCYPVNGIQRFVSVLGVNMAKRLLIASEEFGASELLQAGYLTHLVAREERDKTTRDLAARMAGYAPLALRAMKDICNQAALSQLDHQQANSIAAQCNNSNDLQEGFKSLAEKRPPQFTGE